MKLKIMQNLHSVHLILSTTVYTYKNVSRVSRATTFCLSFWCYLLTLTDTILGNLHLQRGSSTRELRY